MVTLTVINKGARSPVEATVALPSLQIESVRARQMSAPALGACNTFDDPDTIAPRATETRVQGDSALVTLPPASVTALSIRLIS